MQPSSSANERPAEGPKYFVNIEGEDKPWDQSTITTEQIINLAAWPPNQQVIEVDADNNERTLQPGEVVTLKPGVGFAKKVKFRRGRLRQERVEAELTLLRSLYPKLEYVAQGEWVRVPAFRLPAGWEPQTIDLVFHIPAAYPGTPPYGLYVPSGLCFKRQAPANATDPAGTQPPFAGRWAILSWTPVDNWFAAANPVEGSNLVNWAKGALQRFQEGA